MIEFNNKCTATVDAFFVSVCVEFGQPLNVRAPFQRSRASTNTQSTMSDKIAEAQKVRTTTVCDADETKRDNDDGAVVDTAEETIDHKSLGLAFQRSRDARWRRAGDGNDDETMKNDCFRDDTARSRTDERRTADTRRAKTDVVFPKPKGVRALEKGWNGTRRYRYRVVMPRCIRECLFLSFFRARVLGRSSYYVRLTDWTGLCVRRTESRAS